MNDQRSAREALVTAGMLLYGVFSWFWPATAEAQQCGASEIAQVLSSTDWETGSGSWTTGRYGVANPDTFDTPDWAVVGALPDSRAGSAMFVPNLNAGDCGLDDETGVLTLTSPSIAIPTNASRPKIAFNHWFGVEFGWDGGNVKISVNDGPYNLIPGSAFEAGAYSDTLFPATDQFGLIYNTNPLADEDGFTGPENPQTGGSWSGSRIDLQGLAAGGDTIRLRFDFGVDACFGVEGWYLDEVEVYLCREDTPPADTSLTLVVQVVNDGGGTALPSDWTLTASGSTGFSGPGPSVTSGSDFQSGTYDLSTSEGPQGYAASAWACSGDSAVDPDTVTVDEGENVTCTITYDDLNPTLRLQKTIVNDDGGTVADPDAFNLRIDGQVALHDTPYTLTAGPHQASEQGLPGYLAGPWGGDCDLDGSITLALGQNATCTLINDDVAPRLRLVKTIVNNDDGAITDPNEFGLRIDGELVSNDTPYELEAGNHVASEDGLPGYRAGFWGGDCSSDGTISLSVGQDATCTITNDDIGPNIPIGSGLAGGWFNPLTSGQGILLDVEPEQQFMFLAWFTFTSAASNQPHEQRWLTAQGNYSGETATLTLYETLGGKFDDPQAVSTLPVGELTLNFSDCATGEMSYRIDTEGLEGDIPLTRLIPGTEGLCEQQSGNAVQAVDINVGMNGGWFDPETSGQGFLLDVLPDPDGGNFIFLAWFTYGDDTASGQRWLTAQGGFEGAAAAIDVYETTDGSFDDPRAVTTVQVGEMLLDFSTCSEGLISYSLPDDGLEGDIDVTRLVPGGEALCEEISGTE